MSLGFSSFTDARVREAIEAAAFQLRVIIVAFCIAQATLPADRRGERVRLEKILFQQYVSVAAVGPRSSGYAIVLLLVYYRY